MKFTAAQKRVLAAIREGRPFRCSETTIAPLIDAGVVRWVEWTGYEIVEPAAPSEPAASDAGPAPTGA